MASQSLSYSGDPTLAPRDLPIQSLLSLAPITIWRLVRTDFKYAGYAGGGNQTRIDSLNAGSNK